MDVKYNNLFKLLVDKGLSKTQFAKQVGISGPTLAKLGKNEIVSMEVMVKICKHFECSIDDVMEVLPENQ